jgi:mRNA interferase MazF
VKRGEIWWTNFGDPIGSAPGLHRPSIIVSADTMNRSQIATVIVVPLYSNSTYARHPGNVMLPAQQTGLHLDSVANVSQVGSIDRSQLLRNVGTLPPSLMAKIDTGLRLALDL